MGIGTLLLERGVISREDLDRALREQRATGDRLDKVLIRLGMVDRSEVLRALGEQLHMEVIDPADLDVDDAVLRMLPAKIVYRQHCAPVARENGTLVVATSDPLELAAADELQMLTGCAIEFVLADEEELGKFIRTHYGVGGGTLDELAEGMEDAPETVADGDELEQAQAASVVKLVNDLLVEAVKERATDIHIEPYEGDLVVRYRIDGVLQRASTPPTLRRFGAAIISRLKIMSNLNIAEKRKPQDGRISMRARIDGKMQEFDLRVSVIPMLFGEGVVLRVLNKEAVLMSLDDLGMPREVLEPWDKLINRPHGILLVTGPTGSGKSTTLYGSLNRIVSDEVKVITVEDPVEYHVDGVNQIQVNTKVGLTFAAGLRSILRHDPDVVMIGEIRDKETAETAIQASLTGHLVFSTLHTNDAPGAATRLLDMGVEPFLVSSSVEGVLAQRLVRRICVHCKESYTPEKTELPPGFSMPESGVLHRGVGCRACRETGFRGRIGVFELLQLSDTARDMVMRRANAREIADRARADGDYYRLMDDGLAKAKAGHTTVPEVVRALTV